MLRSITLMAGQMLHGSTTWQCLQMGKAGAHILTANMHKHVVELTKHTAKCRARNTWRGWTIQHQLGSELQIEKSSETCSTKFPLPGVTGASGAGGSWLGASARLPSLGPPRGTTLPGIFGQLTAPRSFWMSTLRDTHLQNALQERLVDSVHRFSQHPVIVVNFGTKASEKGDVLCAKCVHSNSAALVSSRRGARRPRSQAISPSGVAWRLLKELE